MKSQSYNVMFCMPFNQTSSIKERGKEEKLEGNIAVRDAKSLIFVYILSLSGYRSEERNFRIRRARGELSKCVGNKKRNRVAWEETETTLRIVEIGITEKNEEQD